MLIFIPIPPPRRRPPSGCGSVMLMACGLAILAAIASVAAAAM